MPAFKSVFSSCVATASVPIAAEGDVRAAFKSADTSHANSGQRRVGGNTTDSLMTADWIGGPSYQSLLACGDVIDMQRSHNHQTLKGRRG